LKKNYLQQKPKYEFFRIKLCKRQYSPYHCKYETIRIMKNKLTEKELEILQIIWKNGPSSVKSINSEMGLNKDVGYTTTLKLMQIMFEKGILTRTKEGKTHIYSANISQSVTQKQLVDKLLDSAFQGSAMKLVMQALGNSQTTKQEIEEIRQYLDKLEEDKL